MSNHEQWQAWAAFKNSGRVGGGAQPPPFANKTKIIRHDQRCRKGWKIMAAGEIGLE